MAPLAILLTVQRATDSYPDGGFAVAAFGLTAGVSAPFRGRLVDRRGMRSWLPAMAAGFGAALLALGLVALASGPAWLLVALAGLAGIGAPPLFASARSLWPHAVEPALVRRGYALTSLISDVGQVAGPALAGVLFVLADWAALLVCAATARPRGGARRLGRRRARRRARGHSRCRGSSGAVLSRRCWSCRSCSARRSASCRSPCRRSPGSGARTGLPGRSSPRSRSGSVVGRALVREPQLAAAGAGSLPVLACSRSGSCSPRSGSRRPPAMLATLLVLAGLAFGPATVSMLESLDVLAPGGGAEAMTWVTTAEAAGWAAGGAVAGLLVVHVADWAPFVLASVILVVPVGFLLALRATPVGG